MGIGGTNTHGAKSVGQDLASVLPQDGKHWYQRGHLIMLNFYVLSLMQFASCGGYDGSIMNGLQALPLWYVFMDNPSGAWLGFINAIYWLGAAVATAVSAWLANSYGRKSPVYLGFLLLVPGVALQGAAHNPITFVMARLLLGGGAGCFGCGTPLLISEIAYPTHRAIVSALYACGWNIGAILASFVTFGTRNVETSWCWRLPSVLQILLPLLALPGFLMCPESPRYHIAAGRSDLARATIIKYHAGGDADSPLVNYEMLEIETTLAAEKAAKESASYLDMIRTKGNRWRLGITVSLAIFSQWSGNGVVSYYLSLVLDTVGVTKVSDKLLIGGGLNIWNLIFSVSASFAIDRLGRKVLFLASGITMLVAYIIVTGLSGSFAQTGSGSVGIAVVPFLFVFFAGYDLALSPLLIAYPVEIWPYCLRSRGLTVMWVTAITAVFFNTFVNPIALGAIGWKYYIVFIVVLIVMIITVTMFYPETRGHSLEQMAHIFDGEAANVPESFETKERALGASHADEKSANVSTEESV